MRKKLSKDRKNGYVTKPKKRRETRNLAEIAAIEDFMEANGWSEDLKDDSNDGIFENVECIIDDREEQISTIYFK
jgi:hypothetical protein